jgi:hypothetical protein
MRTHVKERPTYFCTRSNETLDTHFIYCEDRYIIHYRGTPITMKFFSVAYIALAVGGREFTTGEGTPAQEDGYGSLRGLVISTPTIPFTVNALDYSDYSEKGDDANEGNCDTGSTVDAQYTTDAICQARGPCNIGWTERGEWLQYKFYTTDEQVIHLFERDAILVDITVRIASLRADKFI